MTRLYMLLLVLMITSCALCQSTDTITYSIVNSGNIKGFDKYWKNTDGSVGEWFQFNDRGRGDSMRIIFREDEQGFPTYLSASGKDYMKNDVFEEFSLTNGTAKWRNNAEDEQRQVNEKLFYTGLKTSGGHLIKALKANGNRLKMLPYGEVHLTELEKHVVSGGQGPKTVWLVQVDGFGLTPTYSWIDENNMDFGSVSEWNSSILKGFEKNVDELLSVQKKYESSFFNKLASTIPQQTNKDILIRNVSVFDAVHAVIMVNKDVLIHNGVIQKIADAKNIQKGEALVIDGKGKTILPGLWDMHVHFADNTDGILHMAAGVTHVRDMGNSEILLDRIKQISEGKIIGPRVEVMSGFIDGAGPFAAPTGVLINNMDEGKKAIKNYAAKGYQQIKLYSSIRPEWVKPLIDEAKQYHLRVAGHIPAFMTATQAINAGYNEVTHMNMLVLNFFGDTVDTRSPLRFSLPAQKAVTLDLHGQAMDQFIQLLKEKNITVDPTLAVFEDMFTTRNKEISALFKSIVDHFPLQWQRNIRAGGGGLPVPEGMDDTYKKSFDVFLKITKLLYDNGIRIVPGTDGLAGFTLHRELELYVKAGIPSNKVLQLATYGTAKYTGKDKEYGSIKEGKLADLVMVEGNPVEDITNLHRTKLIITQGKIYDPAKLYRAVSITPFD
jgi:imidazolonepropionase-like amidohydrolase